jgi:hypothetical protein
MDLPVLPVDATGEDNVKMIIILLGLSALMGADARWS